MTPTIHVTLTPSQRATLELEPMELTHTQLGELFSSHEAGEKDGLAVIPARFRSCPSTCIGTGVDCGGDALHRLRENVTEMTMLGVDVDHLADASSFMALLNRLALMGITIWWWETFSSTAGAFRARLVIPFQDAMPLRSPSQWSLIAWPALMNHLGLPTVADLACKDPNRVYFLPRKPEGSGERASGSVQGAPLDWRAALRKELDAFNRVASARTVPRPMPKAVVTSVRRDQMEAVRVSLRRYASKCPPAKQSALEKLCAGKRPGKLPWERADGDAPRNQVWLDALWAVACMTPEDVSSEAILELLVRPAWADEVATSPHDYTPWNKIEDMFERARPKAIGARTRREAERAAEQAAFAGRWSESPQARRELEIMKRRLEGRKGGGR